MWHLVSCTSKYVRYDLEDSSKVRKTVPRQVAAISMYFVDDVLNTVGQVSGSGFHAVNSCTSKYVGTERC